MWEKQLTLHNDEHVYFKKIQGVMKGCVWYFKSVEKFQGLQYVDL